MLDEYYEWYEDEDSNCWHRIFGLYRLSPEQLAEEEKWHQLFREKVETHSDYNENGRRCGSVHPRAQWHEFYDPYKREHKPLVAEDLELVGTFRESDIFRR